MGIEEENFQKPKSFQIFSVWALKSITVTWQFVFVLHQIIFPKVHGLRKIVFRSWYILANNKKVA